MWENSDQNNSEYGHFLRRVPLSSKVERFAIIVNGVIIVNRGI